MAWSLLIGCCRWLRRTEHQPPVLPHQLWQLGDIRRDPLRARVTAHCSAAGLNPNLARGVPGHTIHDPRSGRTSAMVRRHSSCGRRDEGEGRIRITRRGRIEGSRIDRQLAEKTLHAKTKIRLTLALSCTMKQAGCFPRRTKAAASVTFPKLTT